MNRTHLIRLEEILIQKRISLVALLKKINQIITNEAELHTSEEIKLLRQDYNYILNEIKNLESEKKLAKIKIRSGKL